MIVSRLGAFDLNVGERLSMREAMIDSKTAPPTQPPAGTGALAWLDANKTTVAVGVVALIGVLYLVRR